MAFIIGANDVTNPSAKTDPQSLAHLRHADPGRGARGHGAVYQALAWGSGYAGVENPLFFHDNTMMLFSDAKKMVEGIVKAL